MIPQTFKQLHQIADDLLLLGSAIQRGEIGELTECPGIETRWIYELEMIAHAALRARDKITGQPQG